MNAAKRETLRQSQEKLTRHGGVTRSRPDAGDAARAEEAQQARGTRRAWSEREARAERRPRAHWKLRGTKRRRSAHTRARKATRRQKRACCRPAASKARSRASSAARGQAKWRKRGGTVDGFGSTRRVWSPGKHARNRRASRQANSSVKARSDCMTKSAQRPGAGDGVPSDPSTTKHLPPLLRPAR